jgi:hypothetical protein
MSYYRNYRKPYYRRRHRVNRPFEPLKAIFAIGAGLILLGSIASISSGHIGNAIAALVIWAIILYGSVVLIRKIIRRPRRLSTTYDVSSNPSKKEVADINSEKHGCKCYMDGLTAGEQQIAHILSEELSYKDYFIFNNLTIPSDRNGSSQIDHLVVSKFGIFVIESKDFQGWVFGSKDQDTWTQSLPGANKFPFQNPIRQNWSHIMALRALMPFIPENAFQSIVVFTDSCEIKTPAIENVVHSEELIGVIKKYTDTKVSENGLQLALGKLSYVCQTADISATQHIENIQLHHMVE